MLEYQEDEIVFLDRHSTHEIAVGTAIKVNYLLRAFSEKPFLNVSLSLVYKPIIEDVRF